MEINFKRLAKFVALLISTLLIASASAAIYNYMYQDATISVEGMTLEWILGADNGTAGTQINGVTCTLTNLKGPPNGTRVYGDPVRLNNTAGSSSTFDLLIDSVSGDTAEMDSIVVRLYNVTNSASMGNLTVWSGGAQGGPLTSRTITGNTQWRFQWEINWKSTATVAHTVNVNLKVQVPA
ncbi:MAG: hypothetical protein JSV05_01615 [Candidatus Bathyarchaeota archaeon]|nr:MAG: hypothetical protein JSV05_01615 [Candidatus Bathyarchaeota archaeon]